MPDFDPDGVCYTLTVENPHVRVTIQIEESPSTTRFEIGGVLASATDAFLRGFVNYNERNENGCTEAEGCCGTAR